MAANNPVQSVMSETQYHGDANLGGGNFGVIDIDTKPLQQLAAYTFTYNREKWQQDQRDMEDKAKQLADITAYDLTSAIPKDRDLIRKKWDDFYSWVKQNPNVLDYRNNPDGWLEYNKRKNDMENTLTYGKVRSSMYSLREKEIDDTPDADLKIFLKRQLDEEANNTPIETPLRHTQKFDIAPVSITAAPIKKFDVTAVGQNFYGQRSFEVPDMAAVDAQANQKSLGLESEFNYEQDPNYANKTEGEKKLIKTQFEAQKASGKLEPVESAKNFNDAIAQLKSDPKYQDENGNFDMEKAIQSNNPIVAGMIQNVQSYNSQMDEMINGINNGYFQDQFGRQLSFSGQSALNKAHYKKIDLDDGLQPYEILKMRILAASKPVTYKTDIKETDLAIKQGRLSLDTWFKKAEIANRNAETGLKYKKFNEQLKQAKTKEEEDKALDNYYINNIVSQPQIVQGDKEMKSGNFRLEIKHDNSLPFLTVNPSTGKVGGLIPIDGKPIYDKYAVDDKGKSTDEPATGAKIVGYKGGYYEPEYLVNGEAISQKRVVEIYNNYKKADKNWNGSLDKFLKMAVDGDTPMLDVRVRGANGTTTRNMNAAALRIISNQNQKKGQASIFDDSEYQPTTGGSSETTDESTASEVQQTEERN